MSDKPIATDDARLTEAVRLLDQATMRVHSFVNPHIQVVRRDEAEAIIRSALSAPSESAPKVAHSKTEYKRLKEQGANVLPPLNAAPQAIASGKVQEPSRPAVAAPFNELLADMSGTAPKERHDSANQAKCSVCGATESEPCRGNCERRTPSAVAANCDHDWSRPKGFETKKCSKCGVIESADGIVSSEEAPGDPDWAGLDWERLRSGDCRALFAEHQDVFDEVWRLRELQSATPATTIEKCAKVAEQFLDPADKFGAQHETAESIASMIRALLPK